MRPFKSEFRALGRRRADGGSVSARCRASHARPLLGAATGSSGPVASCTKPSVAGRRRGTVSLGMEKARCCPCGLCCRHENWSTAPTVVLGIGGRDDIRGPACGLRRGQKTTSRVSRLPAGTMSTWAASMARPPSTCFARTSSRSLPRSRDWCSGHAGPRMPDVVEDGRR